jgi:transcriptional regulator with XRE-family HTH domain
VSTITRRQTKSELRRHARTRAVRLRTLMLERGVTVADLHRCSGVSESAIYDLRDALTLTPSVKTVERLAAGFDAYEDQRGSGREHPSVNPVWMYDGKVELDDGDEEEGEELE